MQRLAFILLAFILISCSDDTVNQTPDKQEPVVGHPVIPGIGSTFEYSNGKIFTVAEIGMEFQGKSNVTRLQHSHQLNAYFSYEPNGDVSEWIDNEWVTFPIASKADVVHPEKDLFVETDYTSTRQISLNYVGTAKDTVDGEVLAGESTEVFYHLRTYNRADTIVDDRTNTIRRIWSKRIGYWTRIMTSFSGSEYQVEKLVRYRIK